MKRGGDVYEDRLYLHEKTQEFRLRQHRRPPLPPARSRLWPVAAIGRRLRLAGAWLEAIGTSSPQAEARQEVVRERS